MSEVSLIIATHSRPHLLPRAIESAQKSGTNVEVIVVDDASTDETAEICHTLNGIKYVRAERNQRVAGARNLGICASTTNYIAFLDDDDIRLPGSLDKQVEILEQNPEVGLVYGKMLPGDDNCKPTSAAAQPEKCPTGDLFWQLLSGNFIPSGAAVFRKECIYKVGLMEKNLHRIDDWDMWLRIAELYPIMALEEPVYIWRTATADSGQGSSVIAEMMDLAFETYKNKWLKLPRAAKASESERQEALKNVKKWMGEMLLWQGIEGLSSRNTTMVRKSFRSALKINPQLFFRPTTMLNIFKHLF